MTKFIEEKRKLEKKFYVRLAEKLDVLFPKAEKCSCGIKLPCRSKALVFNAWANIYFKEFTTRITISKLKITEKQQMKMKLKRERKLIDKNIQKLNEKKNK